jgi:hypothetical protein
MSISKAVLLGVLFLSFSSFAKKSLPLIEVNAGNFQILSTQSLPQSIQSEIKALQKQDKPELRSVKHRTALLKFFNVKKKVKILGFDGKVIDGMDIGKLQIAYKSRGECTNYPDVFIQGDYSQALKDVEGVVLPESAQPITDAKETAKLAPLLSKGLSEVLAKDIAAQIPGLVSSSSYFRYQGKVYMITPGVGGGGYLGRIFHGYYIKLGKLKLPMCGS